MKDGDSKPVGLDQASRAITAFGRAESEMYLELKKVHSQYPPYYGALDLRAWSRMRARFYEALPGFVAELPQSIFLKGRDRQLTRDIIIQDASGEQYNLGGTYPAYGKYYLPATDEFYRFSVPDFSLLLGKEVDLYEGYAQYDPKNPKFLGFEQVREVPKDKFPAGAFSKLLYEDPIELALHYMSPDMLNFWEINKVIEEAKQSTHDPQKVQVVQNLEVDLKDMEEKWWNIERVEAEQKFGSLLRDRVRKFHSALNSFPDHPLLPKLIRVSEGYREHGAGEFCKDTVIYYLSDSMELAAIPEKEVGFWIWKTKIPNFRNSKVLGDRDWCHEAQRVVNTMLRLLPKNFEDPLQEAYYRSSFKPEIANNPQ